MPEAEVVTRWPDGHVLRTYSPSLVVHDHLRAGASYAVADFVARAEAALTAASARVEARWGHPCTAAQASLAGIRAVARAQPEGEVHVETITPDLPAGS